MYFSKLTIPSGPHLAVQEAFGKDTYSLHQLIWQLFNSDKKREHLFRVEQGRSGLPEIYTLSKSPPDRNNSVFYVETKPFSPKLNAGMKLGYSLRVNPTVTRNGRRHDVLMDAKLKSRKKGQEGIDVATAMDKAAQCWMSSADRLDRWGITLEFSPDVSGYRQEVSRKKNTQIQYSTVDLQGVLRVEEPKKFLAQLYSGFGRARAFGCGLMLIRRV